MTESELLDTLETFVVLGPKAGEKTVRSRPEPENSAPGALLGYAVVKGPLWVPHDRYLALEYGIENGHREPLQVEFGGRMWTSVPGEGGYWVDCSSSE